MILVGKGDEGPLLHIIPSAATGKDALEKQATEVGVIKMEGFAMATVGGGGESIFPGVAEEIEGKGASQRMPDEEHISALPVTC